MNKKIDSINIVLMLFSFIAALIYPFELFLFSYIILGPLHYMTELSWLKERNFFTHAASLWPILLIIGLAVVALIILIDLDHTLGLVDHPLTTEVYISRALIALIAAAFFLSYFLNKPTKRGILVGIGLIAFTIGQFLSSNFYFSMIIGILIPTLIHTTLFTGAFILDGALKSRSTLGILSFVVFVICNLLFFVIPDIDGRLLSNPYVQNIFLEGDFFRINQSVNSVIYSVSDTFVLDSPNGLRIQGFIAFAYTYHYLNWFSKTEVIKWYKVPKGQLLLSASIWILSIALHLIDVKVGIMFIALLSMLHVIMEFPLNHRSFVSIGRTLTAPLRSNS